jgi:hypothetical protein
MNLFRLTKGLRYTLAGMVALFMLMMPAPLSAQETEVDVRGGFLTDSLKIGEETAYFVSARYPGNLTLLFPDSVHNFAPFEYQRKTYFSTETTDGISRDSAIYYLTTFEVERVQQLSLPVYVVHDLDCTVMHTTVDSVRITQFVAHVPDTVSIEQLPLKMNTAYQKVFYNINFWLVVIILTVLLLAGVLIWVFFGKKIRRYFYARRLEKNHASFLDTYNRILAQLQSAFSGPATESALAAWKRYMEQLEARPYTKLTTRETLALIKEPQVTDDLGRIDRAIYGRDTTVVESLENLKVFADQQFKRKLKEVQHG